MTSLPIGRAAISGASSGIGAAYADRLARRGFDLLLIARRADRLESLASTLVEAYGVDVQTFAADLENPASLAAAAARVREPDVSILINTAGAAGPDPTAEVTAGQIERMFRLNVVALSRLSHAALANFRADGRGLLVNIGSVAHSASPNTAAYSGSRAYVLNFTHSLRAEHATHPGVQIQLVLTGPSGPELFSSDRADFTPEQLVDAALAGAEAGELVTFPAMADPALWERLEGAQVTTPTARGAGTKRRPRSEPMTA
ncbi:MAG: SDR family NAD(P)-dependent oxidoreductase [Caulobacteraceae bacterium]|nr:SDR family NAD(P)-dependent oxidoreductase [Caulobacteraceae bacterium]